MNRLASSKNFYVLVLSDIVLLTLSYLIAYAIRFEGQIGIEEITIIKQTIFPILIFKLIVFYFFNLYRGMWRYTSIVDLLNVTKAILISSAVIIITLLMLSRFEGFSRSVFVIDAIFSLIFIGGSRLAIRILLIGSTGTVQLLRDGKSKQKRILIIGAGDAAERIIREIKDNPSLNYKIVGLLDDDQKKNGMILHGVKIVGKINALPEVIDTLKVDEIIIAIHQVTAEAMRKIVQMCESTNVKYRTLPSLSEIIDGKVSIKSVRDISYKDLLGRPVVELENDKISELLTEKVIIVTGAGGSIGSELCRQVCKYKPALVVLFDASESNLYAIQMELKHVITYVKYRAVLGRVQDKKLVDAILKKYSPDVIFHAAAYKHVPLVERNPWEGVFSNIIGTNTMVGAAIKHKVKRFVLVSTDKAVRPTNIMGASKRVAEKIVQFQNCGETKFMAVRFGNVIGSSGSVIPLFLKQIRKGGPVTITHPEITRYFMTIEEAAQLILQAFTMGDKCEIFILEMGTPIKIVDMARDLIKLSGKIPDKEIEIKFTGLRPGEKLYEELITEGEGIVKTDHKKILVLRNGSNVFDIKWFDEKLQELCLQAGSHNAQGIKNILKEIVPEYKMSDDEAVC
ncbi:polysaccharide biosynthesis protein [Desulfosarcina ovata]|uniref:Nucleoside-diphosphate sugar epimerase n=1 Tax=Desulfosarcina ovata subsp. ovata TaxID=2752305 RepID=A0A5K8A636_9BACT|nr:nucleoside-diphosphate sugar epimerase/dehydratase [Desulfosarcina ovata]BBO87640.1 nucleoside-diphosphate sugar epimerase [Desulfosarcina ovata subsp. ovata]